MPVSDPTASTYSPVVDPRDLTSVPDGLGANDELHVPLTPRRGPTPGPPSWLRRLRDCHRLVAGFCTSDRALLRWESDAGSAERFVRRLAPHAALTLDVPFYAFFSRSQRERALARSLSAQERALRLWEPAGIRPIPLVKGLGAQEWQPQLRRARDAGLDRAAFYAREALLERDSGLLHAFLRLARSIDLRPLLIGCFRKPPGCHAIDAAAQHHYVLARHGRMLNRSGRARPLGAGAYSDLLARFLLPGDVTGLVQHNFLRTRGFLAGSQRLSRFGLQLT